MWIGISRAKGWRLYGMDSKFKLGNQLKKKSKQSKKLGDLSLYVEIFNIDRYLE